MTTDFNPRSPHGERPKGGEGRGKACKFQSTLPARGATCTVGDGGHSADAHFNPRSPHGERRRSIMPFCPNVVISIHAPRTGSDYVA